MFVKKPEKVICMIIMTKRVTVLQYYSFLERHNYYEIENTIIYNIYIIYNSKQYLHVFVVLMVFTAYKKL